MITIGSLFTGYGGLDLAAAAALDDAQTIWTCDNDPAANKIITHRYPDAPNLGDITGVDWTAIPPVDMIVAGWPCQPFSQAGKRRGQADERAIWPEVPRAIRLLRPRYVFLENVPTVAPIGELARAAGDLATLGYVGSWLCLRASDIGAPHGRDRLFVLATDTRRLYGHPRRTDRGRTLDLRPESGGPLGDPRRRGRLDLLPTPTGRDWKDGRPVDGVPINGLLGRTAWKLLPTPTAVTRDRTESEIIQRRDSRNTGLNLDEVWGPEFGQFAAAIARWETITGRPAPDPTTDGRLSAQFVEWMMGLPDGWVTDTPGLTRSRQLKALGNGVVPQQAATALTRLLAQGDPP